MKSITDLRLEYSQLSWDFVFPPEIEVALEDDYVADHRSYDKSAITRVATMLLINPQATPSQAIIAAKGFREDMSLNQG